MPESAYDCIVIGSGPGGYVAATRAAQRGMRPAVVEKDKVGGRCLNYACIPAKVVLRSADILSEIDEAGDFGIQVEGRTVDFARVQDRRGKVTRTMSGGVAGLFRKNSIDVIEGAGAVTGNGTVRVGSAKDGVEYEAKKGIIIATGSVKKPIPGTQFGGRVIGTEEAWGLESLPRRLAVVGAGASGAEIASAYARLGSEVLLFEGLDRVLPTEDAEISKLDERGPKKQGMQIFTRTFVEDVRDGRDKVTFTYGGEQGEADYLVIAAGRGADVEGLGLDDAGGKTADRGLIVVDGALRTSARGIWAIGDLVPGPALAHKASDPGHNSPPDNARLRA